MASGAHPPKQPEAAPIHADLVEYLILVAPEGGSLSGVADAVAALTTSNLIRLLDLVVVAKDEAGNVTVPEGAEIDALVAQANGPGEAEGLLTTTDIELATQAIAPGTYGMLVVIEDRWAEALSSAVRDVGGEILAGERIPSARVTAVLAERRDAGPPGRR